MPINFSTTSQESTCNGVKVLVYGGAGMGKTMLCCTAPNPIILSAESGLLSLSKRNIERHFGIGTDGISYDIPVVKISTTDDLTAVYNWLQTEQAVQFETICLDSLSEIGEVVLANLMKQTVNGKKMDGRQAYGALIVQLNELIRKFRDFPGKNVYMTAKMEKVKDEVSGIVKSGPSLPGAKLGQQVPYFYDEVFHIGVGKTADGKAYRFLQTQPDIQFDAKDRSGALDEVEFPHLWNIFSKIQGN